MVRTCSGLGNDNGNQQSEPNVNEHAHEGVAVAKPIMMVGVQEMI